MCKYNSKSVHISETETQNFGFAQKQAESGKSRKLHFKFYILNFALFDKIFG